MIMDMNRYNKYNIKDTDRFIPDYFPKAEDELRTLMEAATGFPGPFAELIIISYLKYHSLKSEWVDANPRLSSIMTDNICCTDHMESLFISSKGNLSFTRDYEAHIREQIAALPVAQPDKP